MQYLLGFHLSKVHRLFVQLKGLFIDAQIRLTFCGEKLVCGETEMTHENDA